MYWYYIRVLWYGLYLSKVLQDPSVQAGSLVLNVSSLFHGLGALISTKEKRWIWLCFAVWDAYLLLLCPLLFVNPFSAYVHASAPFMNLAIVLLAQRNERFRRLAPPLLLIPFALFEAVRAKYFDTYSFTFTPKTTSNLTDIDQILFFLISVAVVVYKWQLVRRAPMLAKRNPIKKDSLGLESGGNGEKKPQ
jgi:hypothetical protein